MSSKVKRTKNISKLYKDFLDVEKEMSRSSILYRNDEIS